MELRGNVGEKYQRCKITARLFYRSLSREIPLFQIKLKLICVLEFTAYVYFDLIFEDVSKFTDIT